MSFTALVSKRIRPESKIKDSDCPDSPRSFHSRIIAPHYQVPVQFNYAKASNYISRSYELNS